MNDDLEEIIGQGYEVVPKNKELASTENYSLREVIQKYAKPVLQGLIAGSSISALLVTGIHTIMAQNNYSENGHRIDNPLLMAIAGSVGTWYASNTISDAWVNYSFHHKNQLSSLASKTITQYESPIDFYTSSVRTLTLLTSLMYVYFSFI